jgi:hypothetical protein
MYDQNTDTAYYEGEFGFLQLDFHSQSAADELDHDAIWKAAREDYQSQQRIYAEIAEQTLDDDRDGEQFGYGLSYTDFGAAVEYVESYHTMRIIFDAESVRFV